VKNVEGAEGARIMFKAGDIVEILPPFRDEGDDNFTWQVLADEDKGRVDICPVDIPLRIKPIYKVQTSQIRLVVAMEPEIPAC
jgi:hypothetical protein